MDKTIFTQRKSITLFTVNVVGAVVYLVMTSNSWAIPQEQGLVPVTGEPFVWAVAALPIIAGFSLLNLTWAVFILVRGQWRNGRLWLLIALIWLLAILIDFAHH